MDLLHDPQSRLDTQQNDLDSLKSSKEGTASSTSTGRVRCKQQTDPIVAPHLAEAAGLDDLATDVWARVAKRVQQLPLLGQYSMDTLLDKEELPMSMRHRKPLK